MSGCKPTETLALCKHQVPVKFGCGECDRCRYEDAQRQLSHEDNILAESAYLFMSLCKHQVPIKGCNRCKDENNIEWQLEEARNYSRGLKIQLVKVDNELTKRIENIEKQLAEIKENYVGLMHDTAEQEKRIINLERINDFLLSKYNKTIL